MSFLRRGRLSVLIAVGVGLAAGGIAYASIPDGSGVIHGCYKTTGGSLRVIDTSVGGTCNSSETPLNWSQTGPKGATGARGPTGLNGAKGATGPIGPTGPSDAFAGLNESSFSAQTLDNFTFKSVQSLSLPAGNWLVNVTA